MILAEIGTAGVIFAYFFRLITSGYSIYVSDPIEGQPVQLSYYLCVFGCGLVFWLLELLRAKRHGSGDLLADIRKVAKLAILITSITTLNLCGCLLAPFTKLPLLVRFLVLFQVSSNLALLLLCAFFSLKEYRSGSEDEYEYELCATEGRDLRVGGGRDLSGGGCIGGGRDFSSGGCRDLNIGGCRGGGRNLNIGGQAARRDFEVGGEDERRTNTEHTFNSSKITEMSLVLAGQTAGILIGFHSISTPSFSSKALLDVALMGQLVAYLCGLTSIVFSLNEHSTAANFFANMGLVCTSFGFILMGAMFVPWYYVLIAVFLFGVVLLIFFWNRLKEKWDWTRKLFERGN